MGSGRSASLIAGIDNAAAAGSWIMQSCQKYKHLTLILFDQIQLL